MPLTVPFSEPNPVTDDDIELMFHLELMVGVSSLTAAYILLDGIEMLLINDVAAEKRSPGVPVVLYVNVGDVHPAGTTATR